ncbi:MAG: U-box domain [Gammaproteobacteria bacterium]|jgi:hypothetical protein|nr:U-box domain [Gammaproteobacteria bacterium]
MAANLSDIEEEIEEEKIELVLGSTSEEKRKEKEAEEVKEPTVDNLLTAFEGSTFFKKGHFTCPISRDLMLEPVVLYGSGQSVNRASAISWIETALREGREPTCPILGPAALLMRTAMKREDAAPASFRPESYFIENLALRSLISASLQEFRNSQGDKYKKVPDPMITPRYPLQPENAGLASNRSRFYRAERSELTLAFLTWGLLLGLIGTVIVLLVGGIINVIADLFFTKSISPSLILLGFYGAQAVVALVAGAAALVLRGIHVLRVREVFEAIEDEPLVAFFAGLSVALMAATIVMLCPIFYQSELLSLPQCILLAIAESIVPLLASYAALPDGGHEENVGAQMRVIEPLAMQDGIQMQAIPPSSPHLPDRTEGEGSEPARFSPGRR